MRSLTDDAKLFLLIHNGGKMSGPKRSIKITDHSTCTSANVIYCITRTYCDKLYIGETGRRLGDRFREYLSDVERNDKDASKSVAGHFNLPNHWTKHMAVCGLSLHLGSSESPKNLSSLWCLNNIYFLSLGRIKIIIYSNSSRSVLCFGRQQYHLCVAVQPWWNVWQTCLSVLRQLSHHHS